MSDNAMFAALDAFNTGLKPTHQQQQQQQLLQHQGLASDFFSFQSPETFAPPADLFESDLDLISQDFDADALQLQLLTVDSHDAFSYIRSDTPTCGPPSTITVSSESAYDSYSTRSESYYNYPNSPFSNYSFPIGLEMDFQRIRVESASEYGVPQGGLDPADPTSFGALPPTPPRSPAAKHDMRSSISDYGPPRRSTGANEYFNFSAAAVAPSAMHQRQPLSGLPTIPSLGEPAEDKEGGRKKYRCDSCPRSFARAYNLKTHRATHDPNRPKPHVCPHRACGRSFSRKHDLGRHLVSIHREESVASSHHSASSKRSIGVDGVPRVWCDSCGKGAVGRTLDCECHDIK